jgi:hypothetical protein
MLTFLLSLGGLGGHSFQRGLGWVADINVGVLYLFAVSVLGVYGIHHGWLGFKLSIRVSGWFAFGRADGFLRSLHRSCHGLRPAKRPAALNLTEIVIDIEASMVGVYCC